MGACRVLLVLGFGATQGSLGVQDLEPQKMEHLFLFSFEVQQFCRRFVHIAMMCHASSG